jgi:hypothetical protein
MDFHCSKLSYRHKIWIQDISSFLVLFFIFLFFIHTPLLYELQKPVFFKSWNFLKEHLVLPGGLVDYLSAFFSQGLGYNLLGAFLLAGMIFLVSFFTRKVIRILWKEDLHTLHWIPGLLLFFLYASYEAPLSLTIGTIIVLICAWLFLRRESKSFGLRLGMYIIISGLLYWLCGGPFLFFAVFCAAGEWFESKSLVKVLIYLLITVVWGIIGPAFFFIVFPGKSWLNNLPIESSYPPAVASWGMLLFFPLVAIFSFLVKPFRRFQKKRFNFARNSVFAAETILISIIFCVAGGIKSQSVYTKRLKLIRASKKNDWQTVLHLGRNASLANPHTCVQVNRALWHNARLLDSAFSYPQTAGLVGLLPSKALCLEDQEAASDLFFELGLVSESLHWGIEYMEVVGKTPEILDRIGVIYLLKGDTETAKIFWNKLKYTLQGSKKAIKRLRAVEEKNLLEKNDSLRQISNYMPESDFITQVDLTDRELSILLRESPENRMAFEYWVAYQLLAGNLGSLWSNIDQFRARGYKRIPLHVQEALVLYAYLSKIERLDLLKSYVDDDCLRRFSEFQKKLIRQTDKSFAGKELKEEFGNTYWYYLRFEKKTKS